MINYNICICNICKLELCIKNDIVIYLITLSL